MSPHERRITTAAAEHHILLRLLDGHTACISLSASASLLDLQAHIERSYGIPASLQRLVCDGKPLHADANVEEESSDEALSARISSLCLHSHDSFTHVTLLLPLLGGKGGFGSLLRATTARVGVKRTSDFSAMRDLHGRRMRHVEQDRELQRWEDDVAGKSEEEKKRLRAEMRTKMARIKRGQRVEDRKACRWGAQCKYKYKCRGSHPEEEESKEQESGQMGGVGVASWQAAVVDEEEIMDDLQAAMRRKAHSEEKEQQDGEWEDDEDDGESEAEQSEEEQKEGSTGSRRRMWDDDLLLDDEDEDDGEGDSGEQKVGEGTKKSHAEEKEEKETPTRRKQGGRSAVEDDEKEKHSEQQASQQRHNRERPLDEEKKEEKEALREEKEARVEHSSTSPTTAATQPTLSLSVAFTAHPSTSISTPSYPAIDLRQHTTAASLQAYGMEHLRAELDRVGLKCGGTLAERAERLFLLKDHTLQTLPKKLLKR